MALLRLGVLWYLIGNYVIFAVLQVSDDDVVGIPTFSLHFLYFSVVDHEVYQVDLSFPRQPLNLLSRESSSLAHVSADD